MDVEFNEEQFSDFGEDHFFPFRRTGLCRIEGDEPADLKRAVLDYVPRSPGVYGMVDSLGRLIYVGKSKLLRNRLLSYFLPNNEEDKAGRIVQSSRAIVWEPQPSEFASLLREQYLIRTFRPRFNVQGVPRRQQPIFICLGRPPAEQLYTSRQSEPKALKQLGPLFGASRATRAVEVLNRVYKLRDCSSKQPCSFTDQLQLFDIELRPGCIRLEIESCLGPCISACSRSDYDRHVGLARDFLDGRDETPIEQIELAMLTAAQRRHFEQAAVLREDLRSITWLHRRITDLARARDTYTFIYPVAGTDCHRRPGTASNSFDVWYLIRRGIIEAALPAPVTATDRKVTKRKIAEWLQHDQSVGGQFSARPETLALVASWFRNHRGELARTLDPKSLKPARRQRSSESPKSTKRAATKSATVASSR